jgi:7,8-dihydropterin-6-yl-methyl-4-(beta-D-ribofuranosyl)aminobenzene 5'-phosphate synthase
MSVKRKIVLVLGGVAGLAAAAIGGLSVRFHLGRGCADCAWTTTYYPKLGDVGTVKQLAILPLIDWYPATNSGKSLVGEAGVSYLIRAGDTTILFDVGLNAQSEHPSPLLRNMDALGVSLEEVDCIFISHVHLDHVGGMGYQRAHTFGLSTERLNLDGITAFVPVPMTHPTARVEVEEEPRVIAPGIINLGPIPRQLFFLGWTPEQSLAVNVDGKGIVLIIGCGHSTIQRIVDRAEQLIDAPLYGVVGGLHYPVTASRLVRFGLPLQRILGTGKWPWDPINREDVATGIRYLQQRQPRLVALSPHDSCDWSLGAFRRAFGGAYRNLQVGKVIDV